MLIEGADANASVTGNESTVPMQLRITGLVEMPNSKTYDATGCFVGLEAWGDVSSERAIVRTRNISCLKNGKTIDMPIKGHVSFRGKNGIKGEVVMRNGKILGWAWGAGFVDGIGQGMERASQPAVGLGIPNGGAVANLQVATSESWRDKQTGEMREQTEWHRVVLFGKLAEVAGEYLRKGAQVYIEGQLRTRSWEDNGITRYVTEILVKTTGTVQMLGRAPQQNAQAQPKPQQNGQPQSADATKKGGAKTKGRGRKAVITEPDGTVEISVTSQTAGVSAVTATINNSSQSRNVTFIADASTAQIADLVVIKDGSEADGSTENTLRVRVTDDMAQGACMALEDAVTLGKALAQCEGDAAQAFALYESVRIPRTARIVWSTREMGRVYHAAGVERQVRNLLWKGKSQAEFYRGMEWLYGWKEDNCLQPR